MFILKTVREPDSLRNDFHIFGKPPSTTGISQLATTVNHIKHDDTLGLSFSVASPFQLEAQWECYLGSNASKIRKGSAVRAYISTAHSIPCELTIRRSDEVTSTPKNDFMMIAFGGNGR